MGPIMAMKRGPPSHCPVNIGTVLNSRYEVLRKLGSGMHSNVWLAKDRELNRYVALKITKSKVASSVQEWDVWQHVSSKSRPHPGKKNVLRLLDLFKHYGPTGIHHCFVFEVMGPSVRSYIKNFIGETAQISNCPEESRMNVKVPLSTVKSMLRQVLLGLDFLHKRGILHNDLHPGNILVSIEGLESLEESESTQNSGGETPPMHGLDFIRETHGRSCKRDRPLDVSELFAHDAKQAKKARVGEHRDPVSGEGPSSMAGSGEGPSSSAESLSKQTEPALTSKKDSHPRELTIPPLFKGDTKTTSPIEIKISDMGAAVFLSHLPPHFWTAVNLRSPEMMVGHSISPSQDIWAFGCLMFELITGRALFRVHTRNDDSSDDEDSSDTENKVKIEDVADNRVQPKGHGDNDEETGIGREDVARGKQKESSQPLPCLGDRNTRYLQQFSCRLGPVPPSVLSKWPNSSTFFDQDGKSKYTPWTSLEAHLDYDDTAVEINGAEKTALVELIRNIMRYEPEKRPSAMQLLRTSWFMMPDGDNC